MSTEKIIVELDAKTKGLEDGLNKIEKGLDDVANKTGKADKEMKKLSAGLSDAANKFKKEGIEVKKTTGEIKKQTAETKKLDQANKSTSNSTKKLSAHEKELGASAGKTRNAFRLQRNASQQLGYQLQDVAVQAQAGTSLFTIFAQQGSQLASVLGPKGALIGAVIAIGGAIGGVLYKAFAKSSAGAEELKEKLEALADVGELTSVGFDVLAKAEKDHSDELRENIQANEDKIESLKSSLKAMTDDDIAMQQGISTLSLFTDSEEDLNDALLEQNGLLEQNQRDLKASTEKLERYLGSMDGMQSDEAAESALEFIAALRLQGDELTETKEGLFINKIALMDLTPEQEKLALAIWQTNDAEKEKQKTEKETLKNTDKLLNALKTKTAKENEWYENSKTTLENANIDAAEKAQAREDLERVHQENLAKIRGTADEKRLEKILDSVKSDEQRELDRYDKERAFVEGQVEQKLADNELLQEIEREHLEKMAEISGETKAQENDEKDFERLLESYQSREELAIEENERAKELINQQVEDKAERDTLLQEQEINHQIRMHEINDEYAYGEDFEESMEKLLEKYAAEQEALVEKLETDKEYLDQTIVDEEERLAAILALNIKHDKAMGKISKKAAVVTKGLDKDEVASKKALAGEVLAIADTLFADNKAIKAGVIVANTASAVMTQMSEGDPYTAWARAAAAAAMGISQLAALRSASKGGGNITGGSGGGPVESKPQEETSTLELSERDQSGSSQTIVIEFATDSGDELIDALANGLEAKRRQD